MSYVPRQEYIYYRIGATEAALANGNFFVRGLPEPSIPAYVGFSNRRPQSTGGQARQGYAQVSLLWPRLTSEAAMVVKDIIEAAEVTGGSGNGTVWLTIPKVDASSPGFHWVDVSGIAIMPGWDTPEGSHGRFYDNVVLRLNNVTVENDPSTGV